MKKVLDRIKKKEYKKQIFFLFIFFYKEADRKGSGSLKNGH